LPEQDLRVESVVLDQVVTLHPDHLTSEELVVRVAQSPGDTDRVAMGYVDVAVKPLFGGNLLEEDCPNEEPPKETPLTFLY
jgi:hypothetical protein